MAQTLTVKDAQPYQKLFPPELRTASIIPRWSVVWTLNKDTVSNHSYFVAFYARQIARLIKWMGDHADLMSFALMHDLDETVTGDIVSPVKVRIVDADRSNNYVGEVLRHSMPHVESDLSRIAADPEWGSDIRKIVKAADRLDALLFLITEERLGNTIIGPRTPDAHAMFQDAWYNLPGLNEWEKASSYQVMCKEIQAHREVGGFGV